MNKKVFYSIFSILGLIIGTYLFNSKVLNPAINISNASAEMIIEANKLTSAFIDNEKEANKAYKNKIIEVYGIIEEITFLNKTNTIILRSNHKNHSVLCDIQLDTFESLPQLRKGQKVSIKGICKGFLNDVILLNCMLINTKKQ